MDTHKKIGNFIPNYLIYNFIMVNLFILPNQEVMGKEMVSIYMVIFRGDFPSHPTSGMREVRRDSKNSAPFMLIVIVSKFVLYLLPSYFKNKFGGDGVPTLFYEIFQIPRFDLSPLVSHFP